MPQQNGVAELKNRTVMEMACTMLKEMKMPSQYWPEAVATSVYILNRSATSALKLITPFEALTGMKPSMDHFKVFGCLAYVYIDPQQRMKFYSKSWAGIFIYYYDCSKAYKIIDPDSMHVHVSRDIRFFEEKPWNWPSVADSDALNYELASVEVMTLSNKEVEASSPFDQSDRQLGA